jgi:hypothetical protein
MGSTGITDAGDPPDGLEERELDRAEAYERDLDDADVRDQLADESCDDIDTAQS